MCLKYDVKVFPTIHGTEYFIYKCMFELLCFPFCKNLYEIELTDISNFSSYLIVFYNKVFEMFANRSAMGL